MSLEMLGIFSFVSSCRQLFVRLCLVFSARMCHKWFSYSAVDLWEDQEKAAVNGFSMFKRGEQWREAGPQSARQSGPCGKLSHRKTILLITARHSGFHQMDRTEIRGGQSVAGCCHLLARCHTRRKTHLGFSKWNPSNFAIKPSQTCKVKAIQIFKHSASIINSPWCSL